MNGLLRCFASWVAQGSAAGLPRPAAVMYRRGHVIAIEAGMETMTNGVMRGKIRWFHHGFKSTVLRFAPLKRPPATATAYRAGSSGTRGLHGARKRARAKGAGEYLEHKHNLT